MRPTPLPARHHAGNRMATDFSRRLTRNRRLTIGTFRRRCSKIPFSNRGLQTAKADAGFAADDFSADPARAFQATRLIESSPIAECARSAHVAAVKLRASLMPMNKSPFQLPS